VELIESVAMAVFFGLVLPVFGFLGLIRLYFWLRDHGFY
jgi:hypothetical protein